ncbi:MAG: hypothetical protein K0M45_03075 [Candidatus Paracaedibacteraceae bacterium]|nr:hypothetical protein [Candidatus Paracaedibacteraceae bacterium]
MIKIIFSFLAANCLPLVASESMPAKDENLVSILKKVTTAVSNPHLISPLSGSAQLATDDEVSATIVYDKILHSITPLQRQQLLENGEAFPNLSLETSQEILFYSLLRWSQEYLKISISDSQVLYPPICFTSYLNFYHPLSLLIVNNFRAPHPSQAVLRDSCLHSLKVFQNLWEKRGLFSQASILNKIGASQAPTAQTQRLLGHLPHTITLLEEQDFPPSLPQDHRVTFQDLPPEILRDDNLKRTQINEELHSMLTLNKAIRSIASKNLKISSYKTIAKKDLWEEMDKQGQLVELIKTISSDLLLEIYPSTIEIINALKNWQPLFIFAQETLNHYPQYLSDKEQSLGLFLILNKIASMAYHYLEQSDFLKTIDSILIETYQLEEIVEWAHVRLINHRKSVTYENLIEEIENLFYIFRFCVKTLDPSELTIDLILDGMGLWEHRFDIVLKKLKIEKKLERKNTTEIYDLLEEEIITFLRIQEEQVASPSVSYPEILRNSFISSYAEAETDNKTDEDSDKGVSVSLVSPSLKIESPFEALYRQALKQSKEI